jgi:hypothetical protein
MAHYTLPLYFWLIALGTCASILIHNAEMLRRVFGTISMELMYTLALVVLLSFAGGLLCFVYGI